MTDKAFDQLSRAGALAGDELFAVENGDGNSRAILASRARLYFQALVAANLATHEADHTAHGISTFVSTVLGASTQTALLGLLGLAQTGDQTSGKFAFGSLLTITWRQHTLSANSSGALAFGSDHAYDEWAVAWTSGDDFLGPDNEISVGVSGQNNSTPTVKNDGDSSATFYLVSIGK